MLQVKTKHFRFFSTYIQALITNRFKRRSVENVSPKNGAPHTGALFLKFPNDNYPPDENKTKNTVNLQNILVHNKEITVILVVLVVFVLLIVCW